MADTNTSNRLPLEKGLWLITVGLVAWMIPGAGHFLIRERKCGIILFAVITTLFAMGLFVGSIGVVDWVTGRIWFYAQILYSPAVGLIDRCAHRVGDRVGVHVHLAGHVSGGATDRLDEGRARSQEPLFVGIQDRHE